MRIPQIGIRWALEARHLLSWGRLRGVRSPTLGVVTECDRPERSKQMQRRRKAQQAVMQL